MDQNYKCRLHPTVLKTYGFRKRKDKTTNNNENETNSTSKSSNNEKNKTQVFILTPDMLKKFGVNLNIPENNKIDENLDSVEINVINSDQNKCIKLETDAASDDTALNTIGSIESNELSSQSFSDACKSIVTQEKENFSDNSFSTRISEKFSNCSYDESTSNDQYFTEKFTNSHPVSPIDKIKISDVRSLQNQSEIQYIHPQPDQCNLKNELITNKNSKSIQNSEMIDQRAYKAKDFTVVRTSKKVSSPNVNKNINLNINNNISRTYHCKSPKFLSTVLNNSQNNVIAKNGAKESDQNLINDGIVRNEIAPECSEKSIGPPKKDDMKTTNEIAIYLKQFLCKSREKVDDENIPKNKINTHATQSSKTNILNNDENIYIKEVTNYQNSIQETEDMATINVIDKNVNECVELTHSHDLFELSNNNPSAETFLTTSTSNHLFNETLLNTPDILFSHPTKSALIEDTQIQESSILNSLENSEIVNHNELKGSALIIAKNTTECVNSESNSKIETQNNNIAATQIDLIEDSSSTSKKLMLINNNSRSRRKIKKINDIEPLDVSEVYQQNSTKDSSLEVDEPIEIKSSMKRKKKNVMKSLNISEISNQNTQSNDSFMQVDEPVQIKLSMRRKTKNAVMEAINISQVSNQNTQLHDSSFQVDEPIQIKSSMKRKKKNTIVESLDISEVSNQNIQADDSCLKFEEPIQIKSVSERLKKKIDTESENCDSSIDVSLKTSEELLEQVTTPTKKNGRSKVAFVVPEKYLNTTIGVILDEPKNKRKKFKNCNNKKMKIETLVMKSLMSHNLPNTISKCAVCFKEMPLRDFPIHSFDAHNLLAWVEGEEPLDMKDTHLVSRLLSKKLKVKKKLTCGQCCQSRTSVDGFISHISFCQKSEKEIEALMEKCPICERIMVPISLKVHLLTHKRDQEKKQLAKESLLTPLNNEGTKRKAATVAMELFKKLKTDDNINETLIWIKTQKNLFTQPYTNNINGVIRTLWKRQKDAGLPMVCNRPNCNFSDLTDAVIQEHYVYKCPFLQNQLYKCNTCGKTSSDGDDIAKHIWKYHKDLLPKMSKFMKDDEEYEFESFSSDESEKELSESKSVRTIETTFNFNKKNIDKNYSFEFAPSTLFSFTSDALDEPQEFNRRYADIFISKNISSKALFKNINCNEFFSLSISDSHQFLPAFKQSCSVAHSISIDNTEKPNWKKYNLFESNLCNDSAIIWCGGPIWALGWAPGERKTKYLAVASDFYPENKFAHNIYSCNNIVQFWDTGDLSNESGGCDFAPKMVFAITHNYGVVWDLDWCPSGCSDDCYKDTDQIDGSSNFPDKIGLLAIACSNGISYIYAVPNPSSLSESESKFYSTIPVIELHIIKEDSYDAHKNVSQASKIKWSQLKGHNIIAVGYSNGFIALFDIKTESPLLKSKTLKNVHIFPFMKFQACTEPINGLVFIPQYCADESDNDSIAIGVSTSMGYSIWVDSKRILQKKGRYSSLTIANPWPQVIAMPEEIINPFYDNVPCSHVVAATPACAREVSIISSRSFDSGGILDSSIWNNKIMIAGANGNVGIFNNNTPLLKKPQISFQDQKKNLIGFIEEVCLDDLNMNANITLSKNFPLPYAETMNSYGLRFIDTPKKLKNQNMKKKQETPADSMKRWSLRELYCIKTHPSESSHYFHAYGGGAGIVRILCTKNFHTLKESSIRKCIR